MEKHPDPEIEEIPDNLIVQENESESVESSSQQRILGYADFFPYSSYRPEQEETIREISESAALRKNIVLIAQNGSGKTIMALSATLPISLQLKKRKIIFLARTYTQNDRAIEETKQITKHFASQGIDQTIGAISIRGRNEMCPNKTIHRLELPPKESMSVCANLRKNKKCTFFNKLVRKKNKEALEKELTTIA